MIKLKALVVILFAVLVFKVRYMVNNMAHEVKVLNTEIARTYNDIDILNAEYAYLERPKYMLQEAHKYGLHAAKPSQIIYLSDYLNDLRKEEIERGTDD